MIPVDYITEWRSTVPWVSAEQVEQDLIISRALVEIYRHPTLQKKLAFRGGTALHKTHLSHQYRYSEDLDFIQIEGEAIGETFDALREVLDPWLGEPRRDRKEGLVKLLYRVESEQRKPLKLKIEINSREHFGGSTLTQVPFDVQSRWFSGKATVTSLTLPWLMGSKLRALYQRKKGRDLFDLAIVLKEKKVSAQEMVDTFLEHLKRDSLTVSRAEFEENMIKKIESPIFQNDLAPLLSPDDSFDLRGGFDLLMKELISLLPGEPWKGALGNDKGISTKSPDKARIEPLVGQIVPTRVTLQVESDDDRILVNEL
jgi:predicted nucleotidyltransferase component of viral defense system